MFDRIVLSAQKGHIRPEVRSKLKANGLPSGSYSKPNPYEIDGVRFFIKFLRQDDQIMGNKEFKIEFNGFDVGSFERATALLGQITNLDPLDLSLYSIEMALDLLVPPSAIQPYIVFKNLQRFRRIFKNENRDALVIENHSPESETWQVGDSHKNSLVVYNKRLELIERKNLSEADLNFLPSLTRIEERYGSLYFSKNPVPWRNLANLCSDIQPFSGVSMLYHQTLSPGLDFYSLEGLATFGAITLMRQKNIPAKVILQKLARRSVWEQRLMSWLLQSLSEYYQPPFTRMFNQSVARFFEQRPGPISGLAFSYDGTYVQEIPHEIIRGKKTYPKQPDAEKPNKRKSRGNGDITL